MRVLFRRTLPVLAGYVFLGFAFGLLMRSKGYPAHWPILMSIFIYSGALEYAAVGILSQVFDPVGSFIMGLMISLRHLFYGLPVLKKYRDTGLAKPFLIFGLTDETFSLITSTEVPEGMTPQKYYSGITLLNYLYWVGGTTLGALAGGIISFNADGLDFALTALFIVLFIEQMKDRKGLISGMTGLILSAASLAVFGGDSMIPAAMALIVCVLLAGKKVLSHD